MPTFMNFVLRLFLLAAGLLFAAGLGLATALLFGDLGRSRCMGQADRQTSHALHRPHTQGERGAAEAGPSRYYRCRTEDTASLSAVASATAKLLCHFG